MSTLSTYLFKWLPDTRSLYFSRTLLRLGRVTHYKGKFRKPVLFLLSTCVWHSNISCGTLIFLLSVEHSFKTYISVDYGK